ncbi:Rab GTPase binding [Blomia tropicalis]|nr:Rab GTPase binding [Blomia tropicalis]
MHHLTNLSSSSSSSSVRAPNQQYQSNRVPTKPSPQYYTPLSPETYGRQTQSSSSYFRSTTYSEFTGRSQQHSGPVHPPHPSRSSLAVARSLSERSKEPEMPHEDQSNESKSYADQIDEVMEQFNANCDISMDDLFGAANSASTSTLNASTSTDKDGKPIRSGKGKGNQSQSGLTKKSSSTSQLSVSGTKKRLGFRKKQATSFSVHRSEEVLPDEVRHLVKQPSSFSSDGETGSLSGDSSCAWMPTLRGGQSEQGEFSHFVEGLGPGQIVGRQALASPNMGEIQLTISEQKQGLEVEVIRARGLRQKSGVKVNPIPYAKVYLIRNRKCVSKAKTSPSARRTLDPLFQQSLLFAQPWKGCSLHVMIWGDYSRTDRKDFMGVVQIVLDNLDLGKTGPIMGWYKLFNQSSVTNLPTKGMSGTAAGPSGMSGGGGGGSISGSVSGVGGASLMSASMESFN